MSAAFTPGPWFFGIAYEPKRGPQPFSYTGPGYYENPGIIGADGTTVVGCDEYHVFNSPADAALLTAAPELYEALDFAIHNLAGDAFAGDTINEFNEKANAALAKARGEA